MARNVNKKRETLWRDPGSVPHRFPRPAIARSAKKAGSLCEYGRYHYFNERCFFVKLEKAGVILLCRMGRPPADPVGIAGEVGAR